MLQIPPQHQNGPPKLTYIVRFPINKLYKKYLRFLQSARNWRVIFLDLFKPLEVNELS